MIPHGAGSTNARLVVARAARTFFVFSSVGYGQLYLPKMPAVCSKVTGERTHGLEFLALSTARHTNKREIVDNTNNNGDIVVALFRARVHCFGKQTIFRLKELQNVR